MKKPIAVKSIVVLAWITIAAAILIVALAVVATAVPPGEGAFRGFLNGALHSLGYDHASFNSHDAGYVVGGTSFAVAPAVLILFAVRRRHLWLLRTLAMLWLVLAAANGQVVFPLVVVVLSFTRSVRRYCRGAVEELEAFVSSA